MAEKQMLYAIRERMLLFCKLKYPGAYNKGTERGEDTTSLKLVFTDKHKDCLTLGLKSNHISFLIVIFTIIGLSLCGMTLPIHALGTIKCSDYSG